MGKVWKPVENWNYETEQNRYRVEIDVEDGKYIDITNEWTDRRAYDHASGVLPDHIRLFELVDDIQRIEPFEVGGYDDKHMVGNPQCRECWSGYPKRCKKGGLIHATWGDYTSEDSYYLETRCDVCGESEHWMDCELVDDDAPVGVVNWSEGN